MIKKFDKFLMDTLFHPMIIWFCKNTRQSQYAISRLFWMMAVFYIFYDINSASVPPNIIFNIFWGLVCIHTLIMASLFADVPTTSFLFMRMFLCLVFITDILTLHTTGDITATVLWLVSEYASTIKNIPPKKKKERLVEKHA